MLAFAALMQTRKPIATYVLLAVLAVVFACEWILGGDTTTAYLMRFGALYAPNVRAGELFRLLSYSFLHAGPVHYAMNSYVLYQLGTSFERLLGSARFLCLYWLTALAGGVTSASLLGHAPSVGASGAIWGILAAEGMLAYRPQGLFPSSFAANMKKTALTNLALNAFVSFRPGVDWGAHLGGGVMGAVLVGSALLTRGMVPLDALQLDVVSQTEIRVSPSPPSRGFRRAATALTLAATLSLLTANVLGRPWELNGPIELQRRSLSSSGRELTLLLPRYFSTEQDLPKEPSMPPSAQYVQFGDIATDPCVIAVYRPEPIAMEGANVVQQRQLLLRTIEQQLQQALNVSGWSVAVEPQRIHFGDNDDGIYIKHTFKNSSNLERVVRLAFRDILRIDVVWGNQFEQACAGLARNIAESAQYPR